MAGPWAALLRGCPPPGHRLPLPPGPAGPAGTRKHDRDTDALTHRPLRGAEAPQPCAQALTPESDDIRNVSGVGKKEKKGVQRVQWRLASLRPGAFPTKGRKRYRGGESPRDVGTAGRGCRLQERACLWGEAGGQGQGLP